MSLSWNNTEGSWEFSVLAIFEICFSLFVPPKFEFFGFVVHSGLRASKILIWNSFSAVFSVWNTCHYCTYRSGVPYPAHCPPACSGDRLYWPRSWNRLRVLIIGMWKLNGFDNSGCGFRFQFNLFLWLCSFRGFFFYASDPLTRQWQSFSNLVLPTCY